MKLKFLFQVSSVFEYSGVLIQNNFNIKSNLLSKENVLALSYMSNNAYYENINDTNWRTLPNYNDTKIQPELIMGYVFSDTLTNTHIISFKGTNVYPYDKTKELDKLNDNLYFSCCYFKNNSICDKDSYKKSLDFEYNYINYGKQMVNHLKTIIDFSTSNIIFTGHSLGGAVATYMGIIYNKTVVTFQTPGEKRYAELINLNYYGIKDKLYNIGHDADPIFNGNCGWWCKFWGYSIDTRCHIGKICKYITNSTSSIWKHKMSYVIDNILEKYDVPECYSDDSCLDCGNTKFSK